jgi:hypothetical protein
LIGTQTWDQNGSNVQEMTRSQANVPTYDADKVLAFNLKNRSYWGSAAYKFASAGPIDLTKYRFMRFDLGWDDRTAPQKPPVRVFLFNATNGKESLAEVFTYSDGGLYSQVVDLVRMSSNGFDLKQVSGVALAISEPGSFDFRFFVDNITLIGITPVPLNYPQPEVTINDFDNTRLKLTIKNPPAGVASKYTWRLSRYDKTSITVLETTTPFLPFSQYSSFVGGRVSGSVTIGTTVYQAKNSLQIPYGAMAATGRLKKVEYDIAAPVNNVNSMASHTHAMNQSREVRAKAANNAAIANPLQLTPIEYKFLWDRGIIRYQFQDLTPNEQQTVKNTLRMLWDTAGILFVEDSIFAPRDFEKSKIPLITIRYMRATDMDATDPAAQASLLRESTCFVAPTLGRSARVVALKNSALGNNQCLEFSSNVSVDATPSDSYVADTLIHEFLHVLGMAHEQVHPDSFEKDANGNPKTDAAGNYVFNRTRVNDAVIRPWQLEQFKFFASVSRYSLPYDDQSIMHYSKYSSTICQETGTDPVTGNVVWDYKLIDPVDQQNFNKAFQDKLDALNSSFPNCARKLTWDDFTRYPECETACATLPLAQFQIGALDPAPGVAPGRGLSNLDKETLRRIYKFNWQLRSQTTLSYDATNPVLHPANVAGSLVTLTKEIVADVKAKAGNPGAVLIQDDPTRPHFFVNQLLKTQTQRRVSGDCVSPETNIVDGRRSCHIPVRCIEPSTKGNLIVPVSQKLIVTERGDSSCSMAFNANGAVCLSGSARGTSANGSYGNVVCALRAYEFTFSEIQ